jgi:hypothetical protein
MARLKGDIKFVGKYGDLTAYTMQGSDEIIIRSKGGASKETIKNADNFARTRDLNKE